jgi:hypothetical protein
MKPDGSCPASVQPGIPNQYLLNQNYPYPFNSGPTHRHWLPYQSSVRLTLFNILGQEVATLVSETQDGGHREVKFEAGGLPSGVYF